MPEEYTTSSEPTIDLDTVIPKVEETLDGRHNGIPIKLQYLARTDGSTTLVHSFEVQNEDDNTWYEAFVDAHTGELVSVVDYTAHASYRVLPIHKASLPEGLEMVNEPQDLLASPNGWHRTVPGGILDTSGNNVLSYFVNSGNFSQETSAGIFDYTPDLTEEPMTTNNIDASRVNAWYIMNTLHDITYRYGFTEVAFNFQDDNFGKGGKHWDRVKMSAQEWIRNDASFSTPPDGGQPICRMYIWTYTVPNRDSVFQNDIIVHEFGHGLTNRMTGGGTAACLQTIESRGLGEGWSDALAEWTQQKSATVNDWVTGTWVTNSTSGVRSRPYSTNMTTNPYTYSRIASLGGSVHEIGEIWANMLHNVYGALVEAHGWSPTSRTNPDGTEGNIVFFHIFVDSLALQPCNPTFTQARDAWIQADQNRYRGANRCLMWRVFASRGLGETAGGYIDSFSVPTGC